MKCLQGSSALERSLEKFRGQDVRIFVVWERVLKTDWLAPASNVLDRVADQRVEQFWDPGRLVSKALGEKDFATKVWDWVAVYRRGARFEDEPVWSGGPVEDAIAGFEGAMFGMRAARD